MEEKVRSAYLTDSYVIAKGLLRWLETWQEQDQRVRDKEVWARGIWRNVLECIQYKKLVSCVNVHQREFIKDGEDDSLCRSQ